MMLFPLLAGGKAVNKKMTGFYLSFLFVDIFSI